jgi:hypothetical protein
MSGYDIESFRAIDRAAEERARQEGIARMARLSDLSYAQDARTEELWTLLAAQGHDAGSADHGAFVERRLRGSVVSTLCPPRLTAPCYHAVTETRHGISITWYPAPSPAVSGWAEAQSWSATRVDRVDGGQYA